MSTKKQIIILGAGESGVGVALLAKARRFSVFVSDKGYIKPAFQEELKKAKIDFESGGHSMERILAADLIVKSPGIPEKAEVIQKATEKGIEMMGEIEFASRYAKGKIVAITGSNGKTTTTNLVFHLLKTAGLNAKMGGNVGVSFARLLVENPTPGPSPEGRGDAIFVLELSSFQLDDILKFRPDVAVLLNITPDHLDRYGYELKNYVASKFRITKNQTRRNTLIFNGLDENIRSFLKENPVRARKVKVGKGFSKNGNLVVDGHEFSMEKSKLKGQHNLFNAACAVRVARLFEVSDETIQSGLESFETPPHRLERVAEIEGVEFINDSKATNVDSVFYALDAMTRKTVWIVGGTDKGNDYSPLFKLVKKKVRAMVFLGADNSKLISVFGDFGKKWVEAKSAEAAVLAAKKLAREGDVVLLSPACASFDLFNNYEDRGDQFKNQVQKLASVSKKR